MTQQTYPTDLNDTEWEVICPYFPEAKSTGRPRTWQVREILNGIFYVVRTGGAWRNLPHDLPPWKTIYHYFRLWRIEGLWEKLNTALREAVRQKAGKEPQPSAAILDSQSAKTAEGGQECGYDAGKKVHGRKRHILVDTQGLLLKVKVSAASVQDVHGARKVLGDLPEHPFVISRLAKIFADGGYRGELLTWVNQTLGVTLEIVEKLEGQVGFQVLPKRWVVERTFAWISRNRRLSRDYERLPETSEAMIYLAMIRLMTSRLASHG